MLWLVYFLMLVFVHIWIANEVRKTLFNWFVEMRAGLMPIVKGRTLHCICKVKWVQWLITTIHMKTVEALLFNCQYGLMPRPSLWIPWKFFLTGLSSFFYSELAMHITHRCTEISSSNLRIQLMTVYWKNPVVKKPFYMVYNWI